MKELVWAAIYICIGAIIALGLYALIACGATKEREQAIYREGFADGHRIGLRNGKVMKIDAALYEELKGKVYYMGRVDVAPGPDSIREGKHAPSD